ncbi:General L-amino acid-binding periplasmic protein AapJ precursor [Hartmannibacter diazotrophicus]|uniref:General L-amino acid-binding periplasmic protein AapJ n=1 Tax=Hartmannibacter diazotrophicus TaxID=1482074 RepID=A0A2C9D5B8_9HYPH|nr:amino acid ABC transporter substrate-binding protein [Hartmannibacter diazotrophicus]SON55338.1 General L-amino acid-binding periplasmic protein AapJ precursor [Hartmannibacter diazotrophicus]
MKSRFLPVLAGAVLATVAASAVHATTLDDVKKKGFVQCGVSTGLAGFSNPDDKGDWTGLDVDYCRAVASAVFGDPKAVKFSPLSAKERFTALQSGEIDVLSRNTTWTMSRDTQMGIVFAGVTYYDGQGFMVPKSLGVTSAKDLDGASVCVQQGTTTELNLTDYFKASGMTFNPVVFEKLDEVNAAYDSGRCDVYTTDSSGLYAIRLTMSNPDNHMVLPEIISKEPLGPSVRQGDEQWFAIAKWVYYALLNAEEMGITQANVEEMKSSENPNVKRLLGVDGNFGESIGLDADWAVKVIKGVGNYGEIFERNVGKNTPLGIARGLNALWTEGGLQYAPPIR